MQQRVPPDARLRYVCAWFATARPCGVQGESRCPAVCVHVLKAISVWPRVCASGGPGVSPLGRVAQRVLLAVRAPCDPEGQGHPRTRRKHCSNVPTADGGAVGDDKHSPFVSISQQEAAVTLFQHVGNSTPSTRLCVCVSVRLCVCCHSTPSTRHQHVANKRKHKSDEGESDEQESDEHTST
jgi:hypothetical protein